MFFEVKENVNIINKYDAHLENGAYIFAKLTKLHISGKLPTFDQVYIFKNNIAMENSTLF